MRLAIVALFVVTACSTAAPPRTEEPSKAPEAMIDVAENPHLDEALALMNMHCGSCHLPDSEQAQEGALKVFALNDPHWYTRLSDEQLESAFGRFNDKTDETGLKTMRAFFDTELSFRGRPRTAAR